MTTRAVLVIGGGPAGMMAAEAAAADGADVVLCEAMPDCGRKLLIAGRSGLNLTYACDHATAAEHYGARAAVLAPWLAAWDAAATRAWADGLGIATFVGSSGRVFPTTMKAAALRQRWLERLRSLGVAIRTRHRWQGWDDDGAWRIETPHGSERIAAAAGVLACGGASWPETGSDGAWVARLRAAGAPVVDLAPANCGFDCDWSPALRRFAGTPLKNVALRCGDAGSVGECVLTATGIEGQAVYALGRAPHRQLAAGTGASILVDLARHRDHDALATALAAPRGRRSWSEHLRRRARLRGPAYSLLRECDPGIDWRDPHALAALIKAVPVRVHRARPLAEAISTAGGIDVAACDGLMLRARPGVFVAGEMLDWDAPTGGFLLQACLATGRAAGRAAAAWVARSHQETP